MENKGLFWFQMCIYSHMVLVLAHIPQDLTGDLWHCSLRLTWFWLPHSGFSLTPLDLKVQRSQLQSSKLTQCVKLSVTPCSSEIFGWNYFAQLLISQNVSNHSNFHSLSFYFSLLFPHILVWSTFSTFGCIWSPAWITIFLSSLFCFNNSFSFHIPPSSSLFCPAVSHSNPPFLLFRLV